MFKLAQITFSCTLLLMLGSCKPVLVDINPTGTPTPYVMLMLDYRASGYSTWCYFDDSCPDIVSENVFVKICSDYRGLDKNTCTSYYKDHLDDGQINESLEVYDNESIDDYLCCSYSRYVRHVSLMEVLQAALIVALEDYPEINIGVMVSNKNGGATILQGFEPANADNLVEIDNRLLTIPQLSAVSDSHGLHLKDLLFELNRYINGGDYIGLKLTDQNFSAADSPRDEGIMDFDNCIVDGLSCDEITREEAGGVDSGSYRVPFDNEQSCIKLYNLVLAWTTSTADSDYNEQISSEVSIDAANDSKPHTMLEHFASNDMVPALAGYQFIKSIIITTVENDLKVELAKSGGFQDTTIDTTDISGIEAQFRALFDDIVTYNSGCQ